jgi:hypothetical protein
MQSEHGRQYTHRTKVPAEKSRLQFKALMQRRGGDQFFSFSVAVLLGTELSEQAVRIR